LFVAGADFVDVFVDPTNVSVDFSDISAFGTVRTTLGSFPRAYGSPAAIGTLQEPPTTDYRPPTAGETTNCKE